VTERRVLVSGIGAVTPCGIGANTFWEHISRGHSAASLITTFDVSYLPTKFAAQVLNSNKQLICLLENQKATKTMGRAAIFAAIAAREAVKDSGLDIDQLDPYRIGTSLGVGGLGLWDLEYTNQILEVIADSIDTADCVNPGFSKIWKNIFEHVNPIAPLKNLANIATAQIAINYNIRGVCQTIATACTSSAQAIGEAYKQIKHGIADVVVTGGCDSMVNPFGLHTFSNLGLLSRNNEEYFTATKPFDRTRDGFMLGEGSAILVLEELGHCMRRGVEPYGEIVGYASTCDAYRVTDEPPEAWGCIEAMRSALKEAGLNSNRVDYINAHGTGTRMNDKTETFAIKSVFKEKSYSIPISSTKSMIGHLVAAAGAVEFVACVLALKNQLIPPTINYQEPDSDCDLDYVSNQARETNLDVILSNSFGFGGQNACLILKNIK